MRISTLPPAVAAQSLVSDLGTKARQRVVDEIGRAIHSHDLEAAKRWDKVGNEVDRLLAA